MPKETERYVCEKCKQEILIVKAGHCVPQCWGQEMKVKAWPSRSERIFDGTEG